MLFCDQSEKSDPCSTCRSSSCSKGPGPVSPNTDCLLLLENDLKFRSYECHSRTVISEGLSVGWMIRIPISNFTARTTGYWAFHLAGWTTNLNWWSPDFWTINTTSWVVGGDGFIKVYRVWITSHLQYKFPWGSWDLKIGGLEIQKNPWYTESTPLLFCWFLRLLWTPQLDFVRHFCGWRFPKTKSPPCMGGDFQQRRVLVHSFNPFEKICASQIGSFPQGSGRKFQKILDTTTCHLHSLKLTYIALKIDLWKRRFLETAIFGGELLVSGRVLGCPWYLVNGLLTLL